MPELDIQRGSNSFETFENLAALLEKLPNLTAATAATSDFLKPALVEAFFNIGALAVDFGNGIATTRYFDSSTLDALTTTQQQTLAHAQLVEANFILGTSTAHRDATIRRQTIGESTVVYRNNRAVIVCPEAVRILQPFLVPGQAHSAAIHV